MQELRNAIVSNPDVLRPFIIGTFVVIVILLLMLASKLGLISSLSFKDLFELKGKEKKEVEKKYETGSLKKNLYDQIIKLDKELESFAIERASKLKRAFTRGFNKTMPCASTRAALIDAIKGPLYEACRSNNFKLELKPVNIKWYVGRIMKKIVDEYEDFLTSHEGASCVIGQPHPCPKIAPVAKVEKQIEQAILQHWAQAIRRKQIDICESKIKLYLQFVDTFRQIGDLVEVRICDHCIEKNRNYISELKGE